MSLRRWQPTSNLAWVLVFAGCASFVRLGFWQLDRAQQKEQALAAFDGAAAAPLQEFKRLGGAISGVRYPHAVVHGHFDQRYGYVLDNQTRQGIPGIEAFAVFRIDDDERALLVNRGWQARVGATRVMPDLPPLPSGAIELHGLYVPIPGPGIRLGGNALPLQTQWPKLTIYLDVDELRADIGRDLYPRQWLLDAEPDSSFVRDWVPNSMPPERHRAYALQWFALAAAGLIIFIVLHYRKVEENNVPT